MNHHGASDDDDDDAKDVIDLVSSSSSDEEDDQEDDDSKDETRAPPPPRRKKIVNPYAKESDKNSGVTTTTTTRRNDNDTIDTAAASRKRPRVVAAASTMTRTATTTTESFVVEEDLQHHHDVQQSHDPETLQVIASFRREQQQQQQSSSSQPLLLFTDASFPTLPSSIRGTKRVLQDWHKAPNCRCRTAAKLSFGRNNNNPASPIYTCSAKSCHYVSHALTAERLHWYRFGTHTGHVLVHLDKQHTGAPLFRAQDLQQGKVGDCWFLSALAVVAERPDLMARLFPSHQLPADGLVQVRLFLDGYWKLVTIDSFLPCMITPDSDDERALQAALHASMGGSGTSACTTANHNTNTSSSRYNPHALSDASRATLQETNEFLQVQYQKLTGRVVASGNAKLDLDRPVTSADLAYSKAANHQLWVPLLEKAYAKSHGSYSSISGGHIAEAFLDLTGAPTAVHRLHDNNDPSFDPKSFWYQLLRYRKQGLPMGCGTDSSAVGIIGMHAYSILDVQEVRNVDYRFFAETGVAHGNVSGFTDYDGTVRLLRIRNPHGQGEWKGDFSDSSATWEKLLQHHRVSGHDNVPSLERTMRNDGTFWMDYDNFLMAFSNVDVVLAFRGNHGKSFASNFAAKKSNHRCVRAFEVSLVEHQPGLERKDRVEVYVMGIQKTKRGAKSGRTDRKVSYKVSDFGVLVGEGYHPNDGCCSDDKKNGHGKFERVTGQMFGFNRNGHLRLVLDRQTVSRLVVMPVSFGHPAATDKELPFVLRFVADAPLIIRELDAVPRMDAVMEQYCCLTASPAVTQHGRQQGVHKILYQDESCRVVQMDCRANQGGTVFVYLCVNQEKMPQGV